MELLQVQGQLLGGISGVETAGAITMEMGPGKEGAQLIRTSVTVLGEPLRLLELEDGILNELTNLIWIENLNLWKSEIL